MGIRAVFFLKVGIGAVAEHVVVPVVRAGGDGDVAVGTVLEVDVRADFKPVGHLAGHFQVGTEGAVIVAHDGTLVALIAEGHVVVHPLARAGNAGVVILVDARTEGGVIPVERLAVDEVLEHDVFQAEAESPDFHQARAFGVVVISSPLVLGHAVRQGVGIVIVANLSGVAARLVGFITSRFGVHAVGLSLVPVGAVTHIVLRAEHVAVGALLIDTQRCAHIDGRFAELTFLCSNRDNAVGTFRTINGSGGSILQDVDLGDVLRVDFRKLAVELHAVEDDERVVVSAGGVDGALATHLEGAAALGGSVIAHIQARCAAHHVLDGLRGFVGQLVGTNLDDRTGQVLLAHRAVTDHHDFFQHLVVFLQEDVDFLARSGLHVLRRITYIRDFESYFTPPHGIYLKPSVEVGDGACLAPFDFHTGTNDGFSIGILHNTKNGIRLLLHAHDSGITRRSADRTAAHEPGAEQQGKHVPSIVFRWIRLHFIPVVLLCVCSWHFQVRPMPELFSDANLLVPIL